MSIILDTNCFSHVFRPNDKRHTEFRPVLEWIIRGTGFLVYGGTKYLDELKKAGSYVCLFRLLKEIGKVIEVDCSKVNEYQNKVMEIESDPDFDDPHLPAIVAVSHCKLICSADERSIKFVTRRDFYPKRFSVPKYYTGIANKPLLKETNIPKDLKKYKKKLKKEQAEKLLSLLD